jgi:hypothetical protein
MRLSIPLALLLAAITTSPSDAESEGQAPPHSAIIREDRVPSVLTPEMLAMPRERMTFEDPQVILFNGRGFVHVKENSLTGFGWPVFPPVDIRSYDFHFNFLDNASGTLIRDDVPAMWKQWKETGTGSDPLGSNLRAGFAMVLVSQDEVWRPDVDSRTGTYHKKHGNRWVSFAIKTWTTVSAAQDEIFLKVELRNRTKAPLTLTLVPEQIAADLTVFDGKGASNVVRPDPFTVASEQLAIRVCSDYATRGEKGFEVILPVGEPQTLFFAVKIVAGGNPLPDLHDSGIAARMDSAQTKVRDRLRWASGRVATLQTDCPQLDDYYRRCLQTVLMCRWERTNFVANPFWSVGTWVYTITWDTSFAADAIAMLDPESLKLAVVTGLREVKMEKTYVGWYGARWGGLYMQEPFALQTMIEAYVAQTGQDDVFKELAGDATVYEWLKRWATRLHDHYGRPDGLLDIGPSAEESIELRTDGYNHIIPVVNGLAVKYYRWLAHQAKLFNDPDAVKFESWADGTHREMQAKLWNAKEGWFDNLYPDGSREPVWTYHLFDLVGADVLSAEQERALVSHVRDGEFLGRYGFYSIARHDLVRWDRIDSDWGGGGQYAGMPLRIARNLYRTGRPELGWDVLRRFSRYVEFFPYIPQNPRTDRAYQDHSSMPTELSAGAGLEAVWFGVFGLQPQAGGSLIIKPAWNPELGTARLLNFRMRGHTYDVTLTPTGFEASRDGKHVGSCPHGRSLRVPAEQ